MVVLLVPLGVLLLASLALAFLLWVGLRVARRRPQRYWLRVGQLHLLLLPLYLLVVIPGFMGWFGSKQVRTRGDESAWVGPLLEEGRWLARTKGELQADAAAGREGLSPVQMESGDGVPLRGFWVPAERSTGTAAVVVHGLFRSGWEVEPVGRMFRDLGCDVLLLEMRNHGGSGRSAATFGRDESRDVVAAVRYAQEQGAEHVVLFGVSLGGAAVCLATEGLPDVGGVVVDAPMESMADTAVNMLGRGRASLPTWFLPLALRSLELWSGIELASLRPIDALEDLPPKVPVLIIAGAEDHYVPMDSVDRIRARFAGRDRCTVWVRDGSGHGKVWSDDPDGYRAHLKAFLEQVRDRGV